MFKVYISHSTQKNNVGVGKYGTEEDQMTRFAARVIYWLTTQKVFRCRTNRKGWSLDQTANDANAFAPDAFIDNHTDAGPSQAQGTTVFYNGRKAKGKGYKLATLIYKRIAPLSPGKDRGVRADTTLYSTGLYIIQNVNAPSCLVEHFFHSNAAEVKDYLATFDEYTKNEAKGLCDLFGVKWIEPVKKVAYKVGIVTADALNVRSEASIDSKIIKTLKKGDRVRTYGIKNGFYNVGIGWVSTKYIKLEKGK